MKDKRVLITGASSGIGYVTALELAKLGAELILIVRNREKGKKTRQEIINQSGNGKVNLLFADLSVMDEVRKVAAAFKAKYNRLDVLINNAGIMPGKRTLTPEKIEVSWATNHLAPFLLTNLLMDELLVAGNARIINVSSEVHRLGQIDVQHLHTPKKYSAFTAYCDSKLANILFTKELDRRLDLTDITVNCLHPGVVSTNFARKGNSVFAFFFNLSRIFMISPAKGAETTVYLASSAEVEGVSGKYFKKKKAVAPSEAAEDKHLARKLWKLSEKQTGFKA